MSPEDAKTELRDEVKQLGKLAHELRKKGEFYEAEV